MKRIFKVILIIVALFVVVIAVALTYLKVALPDVGEAPDITIEYNDATIERGAYLTHHVMACMDCHSQRDWTLFSGPIIPGTLGMGGEIYDQRTKFPGSYIAGNLTPANLDSWTDGEIFRAITTGVNKEGQAMFPVMPYHEYGKVDEDDIKAVIAYLRTLEPIEYETEPSKSDFPMNFIINTIPQKPSFEKAPSPDSHVAYGGYLVKAAACYVCHTKQSNGKFVGEPFAGGMEFYFPNGSKVVSSNITPHESGIGSWDEDFFVHRFKLFADPAYEHPKVNDGDMQTIMPWLAYSEMKEDDLRAIYRYLQTLEPKERQK